VVLVVLFFRGSALPTRGQLMLQSLPPTSPARFVTRTTVITCVVAVAGLFLLQGSYRAALTTSMVLAMIALSFTVVTGYVGQISFAQYSLAGASALFMARLTTEWGVPFPIAPIIAALFATLIGVIIGIPALRVRGVNLAIVTVAAGVAISSVYFENNALNGGASGATVSGPTLFGLNLEIGSGGAYPRVQFGLLVLVVLVIIGVWVANLRRSRLGAKMLAVRANERGAAANGINVAQVKLIGFAIGSFIAGLGGAFLAYQQTTVTGDSFDALTSIMLFATCYIAGITTVAGALVAGFIGNNGLLYVIINNRVSFGNYYLLITGLLLVFAVIRHPEGIGGVAQEALKRLIFRRQPSDAGAAPPELHTQLAIAEAQPERTA
jgi:ABC-type branched-subunit amino acid transport system permease subunit